MNWFKASGAKEGHVMTKQDVINRARESFKRDLNGIFFHGRERTTQFFDLFIKKVIERFFFLGI